jgi:S1-C subfamily serine protease
MPAVVMLETERSTGSGFFVAADTVVTNYHVVSRDDLVTVISSTGGRGTAHVEDRAERFDLAVLKMDIVDPTQVTLALARPSDAHVGTEVIAIGAP